MGVRAISSVFDSDIRPSVMKFVLVAIADCADETGVAYPSVAAIVEKTSLDRKTVLKHIAELVRRGLMSDTGRRVGATNQVKVYKIVGVDKESQKRNSSTFDGKQSQISAETVPNLGHGTVREPSGNHTPRTRGAGGSTSIKSKLPTSEPAILIAKLFRRELTAPWSEKEIRAFRKLQPFDMADLELIESYYAKERSKADGIHRRDLITFLNNYPGELDRAKNQIHEQTKTHPSTHPRGHEARGGDLNSERHLQYART